MRVSTKSLLLLILAASICGGLARADEATRQVQEELRKRNLFYGDIDGRETPALAAALRDYQERKGFTPTGEVDADTLRSMGISPNRGGNHLPNVPVLRSDRGVANENNTADNGPAFASLPAAINAPPPSREELRGVVHDYLEACQTPSITDDLNYYGGRVDYFSHGSVTKGYIRNELVAYAQQWPERSYAVVDPITVAKRGFNTEVRCRVSFKLANPEQNRKASGQTQNTFVLARRSDSKWEIVGQREERVRHTASRRRSRQQDPVGATMRRVQRTMRKFFR